MQFQLRKVSKWHIGDEMEETMRNDSLAFYRYLLRMFSALYS